MKTTLTVTITATIPNWYGPDEVADVVRFHLGLSDLNSIEADISAVTLTGMIYTPGPHPVPECRACQTGNAACHNHRETAVIEAKS